MDLEFQRYALQPTKMRISKVEKKFGGYNELQESIKNLTRGYDNLNIILADARGVEGSYLQLSINIVISSEPGTHEQKFEEIKGGLQKLLGAEINVMEN